jgi:hypothetical protein
MQRMLGTFLAAALALAAGGPAAAQEAKQVIGEAMAQVERGELDQAQGTLRQAMLALSNQAPLSVGTATLVSEEAPSYANFQPRADNVYRPDEPILAYVEPRGYAFERDGETWRFGLRADLVLLDKEGKILAGQENFGRWTIQGRRPVFEFFMSLTYTLTGLEPGDYIIRTVLHDLVDEESATFELPIKVAAP